MSKKKERKRNKRIICDMESKLHIHVHVQEYWELEVYILVFLIDY